MCIVGQSGLGEGTAHTLVSLVWGFSAETHRPRKADHGGK